MMMVMMMMTMSRRSCGDPGGVLSKRSLCEDLADDMSWRCLYESEGFERLLYQDLVRSAPAAAAGGRFMTSCEILLGVLTWRFGQGLLRFLVMRSCGDPSGMRQRPLHDLAQVLARSS